jgi:hypothetical protein
MLFDMIPLDLDKHWEDSPPVVISISESLLARKILTI